MVSTVIWLIILALIFVVGYANITDWRERRRMTPEERKLDDEQTDEDLQIW